MRKVREGRDTGRSKLVATARDLCQNIVKKQVLLTGERHPGSVVMQFVCEAPPKTWFRIETEGEAALESGAMNHAVEKYFKQARDHAATTYVPPKTGSYIEQNIGLKAHILRAMPRFLTLRDGEGNALVTAMLPPTGQDERAFRPIIVGPGNSDPYLEHGDAIHMLAQHYDLTLDPGRCYPYRRG
jgi:hypothetical protein